MKAVVVNHYGTPDALELQNVARPTPKAGEVLVQVHAASVNDWDWELVGGTQLVTRLMYGLFKPKPLIIGCDIAGCVEAVGDGVDAFQPGDRVFGDLCMCGFGAFAEYACVPENSLGRIPARMTYEQAAAIPQAGMLAVQGLIDVGELRSGQTLLLNGAGGGVGTFALQIAKFYDVEITVTDKSGKLDMLRSMGADHMIDYRKDDFTKTGKAYDLILDTKTNRSPFAYARALKRNGTYVSVGGIIFRLLQLTALKGLISRLFKKHLRMVMLKPNKDLAYMNELFEAGSLVPVIDGSYAFEDAAEAMRHFGTGDHRGKIIITMR